MPNGPRQTVAWEPYPGARRDFFRIHDQAPEEFYQGIYPGISPGEAWRQESMFGASQFAMTGLPPSPGAWANFRLQLGGGKEKSFMVNRPTQMMAGETGPEVITARSLSGGSPGIIIEREQRPTLAPQERIQRIRAMTDQSPLEFAATTQFRPSLFEQRRRFAPLGDEKAFRAASAARERDIAAGLSLPPASAMGGFAVDGGPTGPFVVQPPIRLPPGYMWSGPQPPQFLPSDGGGDGGGGAPGLDPLEVITTPMWRWQVELLNSMMQGNAILPTVPGASRALPALGRLPEGIRKRMEERLAGRTVEELTRPFTSGVSARGVR